MRTAGGHRGSRRTAAAALLVAAATLIARTWATSHDAAVQHVRCAEHGDVTDVAFARGAASPAFAATRPAAAASAGDSEPSGHHHCAVRAALQDGTDPPAARAAVSIVPPPATATPPCAHVVPARGRAQVLASAPKTSPPAARA
jgi:hypothetical protein